MRLQTGIHTYTHAYKHTCIHTHIHTHMHTYTHAYIHTYIHTCIHTHMHTYTHAYMHTCIHTHMHTQPQIETLYLHKYVLIVRSDHKMPIANLPQGTNRRYFGDACECDSNTCPVNTEQSSRFFNLICSGEVQFTSNKHLQPVTYILVPSPVFKQTRE